MEQPDPMLLQAWIAIALPMIWPAPELEGAPLMAISKIFSEFVNIWSFCVTCIEKHLSVYHRQVFSPYVITCQELLVSIRFPKNFFNPLFFSSNLSVFWVNVGSKRHRKPINKGFPGIVNYSNSISATISCIHIVRDTSYLVWIFCQIRLIRFVSESFVDDLETFK